MSSIAKSQPTPLVHVGYHKTGTTWLQSQLFVDTAAGFQSWDRAELLDQIVLPPPFGFDVEAARRFFAGRLDEAKAAGLVPVFSHERLCGNPHSGGYDAPLLADRIAATFPDARILIVIREQRSALVSWYKQYVAEGGALSLRRYLHPPESGRARIPLFRFTHYEYHELIDRYRKLFDPARVLVLAYEELRRDPEVFSSKVAEFAGTGGTGQLSPEARHVSLSAFGTALKRPFNFLLVRDRLNPTGLLAGPRSHRLLLRACARIDAAAPGALRESCDRRLRDRVAAEVGDRFRDSNRATRDLCGIDLASYGYDL